jgi:hypothetical protein
LWVAVGSGRVASRERLGNGSIWTGWNSERWRNVPLGREVRHGEAPRFYRRLLRYVVPLPVHRASLASRITLRSVKIKTTYDTVWLIECGMTRKDIAKAVAAGARWREAHPVEARSQRLAGTAASNRWRASHPEEAGRILKDAHGRYMLWRKEQPEEAKATVIKAAATRHALGPSVANRSGYKGVYWDKRKRNWAASITLKGKHVRLGYFRNKAAAGRAYNKAALRAFGKHAYQNPVPARRRAREEPVPDQVHLVMKFY